VHDCQAEHGPGESGVEPPQTNRPEGGVGDLGRLDEHNLVELQPLDRRGGNESQPGAGVEPVDLTELDAPAGQLGSGGPDGRVGHHQADRPVLGQGLVERLEPGLRGRLRRDGPDPQRPGDAPDGAGRADLGSDRGQEAVGEVEHLLGRPEGPWQLLDPDLALTEMADGVPPALGRPRRGPLGQVAEQRRRPEPAPPPDRPELHG